MRNMLFWIVYIVAGVVLVYELLIVTGIIPEWRITLWHRF